MLGRADHVDAGGRDAGRVRCVVVLGRDARDLRILVRGGVRRGGEVAHGVEPRVGPAFLLGELHQLVGDARVDREAMGDAAVGQVHRRALLADQRRVEPEVAGDARRAGEHAPRGERHHHARGAQARDGVGDVGIRQRDVAGAGRDQRAVDVEGDEACVHWVGRACRDSAVSPRQAPGRRGAGANGFNAVRREGPMLHARRARRHRCAWRCTAVPAGCSVRAGPPRSPAHRRRRAGRAARGRCPRAAG